VPRYQYACTEPACGHEFEAVQSFSDPALSACPVCEGRLRKVYSAVGVVFKGSGFYRTDSRSENGKKSSTDKEAANNSATNGSSSGSDAAGGSTTSSTSTTSSSGSSGSTSGANSASSPSKAAAAG
jgi:putative FmdB family regulatory protein